MARMVTRRALLAAVNRCAGNRSEIARDLGIPRPAVLRLLRAHDLLDRADLLAARAAVSGSRGQPSAAVLARLRADLLAAVEKGGTRAEIARRLGVSEPTLYRRLRKERLTGGAPV